MWTVEYADTAEADLLALDKGVSRRIRDFFRERVANHPAPKRLAEALKGDLAGLYRFRIGDYRAVCSLRENRLVVLVAYIDHRSVVYKRRGSAGSLKREPEDA